MRHRHRESPVITPMYLGVSYFMDGDIPYEPSKQYGYLTGDRRLRRESCWDELHKGPPYRSGGPLEIRLLQDGGAMIQHVGNYSGWIYRYDGGFACTIDPTSALWYEPENPSFRLGPYCPWDDARDYGAEGWNKARPGQPTADLGVFLAELRDIPRMLKQTANFFRKSWRSYKSSRFAKQASRDWLAANFGWLPFVNDVRKFIRTTENLEKALQQLARDNGRWVKRSRTVEDAEECTVDTGWVLNNCSGLTPVPNVYFYTSAYPHFKKRVTFYVSRKFWFEARFRYYIPSIKTKNWRRNAIRKLYGLSLTPEVVWEAMPWSWLVDWCSNVGDIIANLDNNLAENLVAKYAYIMGHQIQKCRYEYILDLINGGPLHLQFDYIAELKERCSASPFGFDLTGVDFNPRQWSLLTALGLSRLKF